MRRLALCLLLTSCAGLTPRDRQQAAAEVGTAVKTAAPFLPPPFDLLATAAGTLLLGYGTHRTVKSYRRPKSLPLPSQVPPVPQTRV
jgi:hypothetical protein